MKIDDQLINMESDLKDAQNIKDIVIRKLYREFKIDKETCNEYLQYQQIFIFKTSWWRNWKNIFPKKKENIYYYQLLNVKETNNNPADENTNGENNDE